MGLSKQTKMLLLSVLLSIELTFKGVTVISVSQIWS